MLKIEWWALFLVPDSIVEISRRQIPELRTTIRFWRRSKWKSCLEPKKLRIRWLGRDYLIILQVCKLKIFFELKPRRIFDFWVQKSDKLEFWAQKWWKMRFLMVLKIVEIFIFEKYANFEKCNFKKISILYPWINTVTL